MTLTQHMDYSSIIGKQQETFNHLVKVNEWTKEQGMIYFQEKELNEFQITVF